jgi:hypothetical protein
MLYNFTGQEDLDLTYLNEVLTYSVLKLSTREYDDTYRWAFTQVFDHGTHPDDIAVTIIGDYNLDYDELNEWMAGH